MRMLFVSGTTTGGSAVSTHELARVLGARGHAVGILAQRRTRPRSGLVVAPRTGIPGAVARLPGRAWNAAGRVLASGPGAPERRDGVDVWTSAAPERVLAPVHDAFRPDVVVVNSVHRKAWTSLHAWLRRAGTPVVLYVREAATLEQIPIGTLAPDLVLTNSAALDEGVAAQGLSSWCVPSVIDFARCEVVTSAEVALLVNPIPSRGLSVAVGLAADNPDVPFVFQISWPLDRRDDRALRGEIDGRPNIELRRYDLRPARVYRDARVLLVPYLVDQRPRVVAEAQYNGIPVLASDLVGHREAVGPGGMFVPPDGSRDDWNAAFRALFDDATARRFGIAARAHARRDALDPAHIAQRFEALMEEVVSDDGAGA